jgi:hypothetical protein
MARQRSTFKEARHWRREYFARVDEAVVRSGIRLRDEIVARFQARGLGYTTGNFASGEAADIKLGALETRGGVRRIAVYSPARRYGEDGEHNYPAYWELGHFNVFTGRFERVETFRPAAEAVADEIPRILVRQFRRGARRGAIEIGVER